MGAVALHKVRDQMFLYHEETTNCFFDPHYTASAFSDPLNCSHTILFLQWQTHTLPSTSHIHTKKTALGFSIPSSRNLRAAFSRGLELKYSFIQQWASCICGFGIHGFQNPWVWNLQRWSQMDSPCCAPVASKGSKLQRLCEGLPS